MLSIYHIIIVNLIINLFFKNKKDASIFLVPQFFHKLTLSGMFHLYKTFQLASTINRKTLAKNITVSGMVRYQL